MSFQQIEVDPRSLKPNPWNTNVVSPENEAKLDASITRVGFVDPVLVRTLKDGSLEILGGEHRTLSAIRLGLPKIPALNLGMIDDVRAKEIGLLDNSRYGTDDMMMLGELLQELGSVSELAEFLPISSNEMDAIISTTSIDMDDLEIPDDDDDAPSEPPMPEKKGPSHTLLKIKVPVADAERVIEFIENIVKEQGLMDDDSMAAAGMGLVWLVNNAFKVE